MSFYMIVEVDSGGRFLSEPLAWFIRRNEAFKRAAETKPKHGGDIIVLHCTEVSMT